MIKKLQILLLVPLAAFVLVLLYGLNPSPNKTNEQPNVSLVDAPRSTVPVQTGSFTDADFARHVEQLKESTAIKRLYGDHSAAVRCYWR